MSSELYINNEITIPLNQPVASYNNKKYSKIITTPDNNILELSCYANILEELPSLGENCRIIDAHRNRIKYIDKLSPTLTSINLSRNHIRIFNFTNLTNSLTYLNISHNFIREIPILPNNLGTFICCENKLTQLPVNLPYNLRVLKCCKNFLQILPPLPNSLRILACKYNRLAILPDSIRDCNLLEDLKYEGNLGIQIPEDVLELLEVIIIQRRAHHPAYQGNLQINHQRTIYADGQNVHDSTIQKDVLKIIEKLKKEKIEIDNLTICLQECKKDINDDDNAAILTNLCHISTKHSEIGQTFGGIFVLIWNRIRESPNRKEMVNILAGELSEMQTVCYTGRISRLVNVLSGFYDNINVGISETAQIQGKYDIIAKKLKDVDDKLVYNIVFKYMFKELLEELKLDPGIVTIWLEPFDDYLDEFVENSGDMWDLIDLEKRFEAFQLDKKRIEEFEKEKLVKTI